MNVIPYSPGSSPGAQADPDADKLFRLGFGRRLRKLRQDAQISRNEMSETLDMEANSLGLIERGVNGMSKKNIVLLNIRYGFDLNFLMTGRYMPRRDGPEDASLTAWVNIYERCPEEKVGALMQIASQVVDNF